MSEIDAAWESVIPFVLCNSQGGPYEDQAFTAGFVCGSIYVGLGSTTRDVFHLDQPVKRDYLPQVDLIAMRFGFTVEVTGEDPDWCHVTFVKGGLEQ